MLQSPHRERGDGYCYDPCARYLVAWEVVRRVLGDTGVFPLDQVEESPRPGDGARQSCEDAGEGPHLFAVQFAVSDGLSRLRDADEAARMRVARMRVVPVIDHHTFVQLTGRWGLPSQ